MPIIVKLHRHPINAASAASSKPLAISQRIFSSIVPAPPAIPHLFPKGKKTELRELKALYAHRDSHNGDAPKQSCQNPAEPEPNSTK